MNYKLFTVTTDIDVIIKQVILAVRDIFWKIERSSDPYIIDKVRFASYYTKLTEFTTRMEITIKAVT